MSSITLNDVHFDYPGGTTGLTDIDLSIADGEFLALVGPSGSGKTTLLRTIAGFLQPSSGTVTIGGDVVAGNGHPVPPEDRKLGMVFQQHALWPHRSVGKNVSYPLEMAGVSRADRKKRVADALSLVGLPGLESRDPATLSGGQRQRVALARALVRSPRALLLDEALTALDEPLRDRLRLELRSLTRAAGLTVVHVTHDRNEALALADRVAVLDGGRVVQIGTPEELVQRPASSFVAHFLSDANLIDGVIDGGRFHADGHPIEISAELVENAREGRGTLAVLPSDIALSAGSPHDCTAGTVTSSLFGRDASDVVVDSHGVAFRCSVRGVRPSVGDEVTMTVRRGIFDPVV
ncbi:ABC transporter ATP-binding protein [Rhodococcoides kyotonense]|uniref:Trehalose import ATP-binding protein SugC n=1 Tax=Rhodococcoides kyotonense TaxID=398843 RepID=A0A239L9I6_9NOCA|nr:ABC transporter ATP-binding protein [Rhodococcus kyotonensis]SNT26513.1 iron(III) transport system ATP-binding protein [Rhodococcus kyotonensis]